MAIPDYETLMLPVLTQFANGASSISECVPALKLQFGLTDEEAAVLLPSGRTTVLASRAHWARTYLSKAGLLSSPRRNVHVITEEGRRLLAAHPDRIDNKLLGRFEGFDDWRTRSSSDGGGESHSEPALGSTAKSTPDELIANAYAEIERTLASDLLAAVQTVTPEMFEQIIVDLLLAMGYGGGDKTMGERLGKTGDGGIDGIINEDRLGLDAVFVQAKRYASDSKVGRPALQAFVGSLTGEGATKGVFVTTSDFSREARDYLNKVQHRIVLINGERLARLMIQYEVGVRASHTYVVRAIDDGYFESSGER